MPIKNAVQLRGEDSSVKQQTGENKDELLRKQIWRNRQSIKAFQRQSSFIRFLFLEYRKIRDFGKKTHIFDPKIFPPGIRLNKDVRLTFTKYLQPWSVDLYKILTYVLKTGWPHLHKKEYNLIVVLKRLCERIVKMDFTLLNYKDRYLIDKLRSLEILFLVLYYHNNYPETVISSLQRILSKDPDYKGDLQEATGLIKRILFHDADLPSLYNFLLGLNMLKYKRFFHLRDLIQHISGEVINSKVFECEEDIKERIDTYIEETRNSLLSLIKQKQEIIRIESFLPMDQRGAVNYDTLKYFYESSQLKKSCDFSEDQKDVILLIKRFMGIFTSSFENLLNGKVYTAGTGKVEIFSPDFFQIEFSKIYYLMEKLEKVSFDLPVSLSIQQYLLLKRPDKNPTKTETLAMMYINDGIELLNDIGKKLERILHLRQPAAKTEYKPVPIGKVALKGESIVLPYEDKILTYKKKFGGKTIAEALTFIVTICYLACLLFNDQNISALLHKKESINDDINNKLKVLERIADSEVYKEFKELYSL